MPACRDGRLLVLALLMLATHVYGARFHVFQCHLKLINQDFDSPIYLVYTPLVFVLPMFITNIINWI